MALWRMMENVKAETKKNNKFLYDNIYSNLSY